MSDGPTNPSPKALMVRDGKTLEQIYGEHERLLWPEMKAPNKEEGSMKVGVFTVGLPDLTPEVAVREIKVAGYDGVRSKRVA